MPLDPRSQIEFLRRVRVPAAADAPRAGLGGAGAGSLSAAFAAEARHLRARARSLGAAGGAFTRLVPGPIAERCTLVGIRAGVLSVRCDDAATGFELDRWLRTGGELRLITAAPTVLTRVKRVGLGAGTGAAPGARPRAAAASDRRAGPRRGST